MGAKKIEIETATFGEKSIEIDHFFKVTIDPTLIKAVQQLGDTHVDFIYQVTGFLLVTVNVWSFDSFTVMTSRAIQCQMRQMVGLS